MNPNPFNKNIILFGLILIGFYHGNAQSENTGHSTSTLITDLDIETLSPVSEGRMKGEVTDENSIFIQQIGSNNTASATIYGKNKEANLVQTGYANRVKINLAGKTVTHNLLQNGNNNLFLEYGNSPKLNIDRRIIQEGNNQGIVIFGSNSLTDKLILSQQGSSKTITIRNFN
ncbi:MAG: curlin repeat-containing protein [Pricia sp.]